VVFIACYLSLEKKEMQLNNEEITHYASALRSSSEQILSEYELILSQKFFNEIFGSIYGIGAIINKNRQIVFVNDNFLNVIGINNIKSVLGKRPGEVISCINADNNTGGCGTTLSCSSCGAINAILESQRTGQKASREALITARVNGKLKSMDLNVTSVPVTLAGHTFYELIIQDISHEKRRDALERIFFHDLLNSATGLSGLLSLLKNGATPNNERQLIDLSEEAIREIIDEIQMHRHLLAAENGDLRVNIELAGSLNIIHDSINSIGFHESGKDKKVVIDSTKDISFETDKVIIRRVLINLLKNALEATAPNGQILIGADDLGSKVKFWVKNDQAIPANIQLQLFQRSFSTKGKGRGLGTYSIRLLTENYLKGNSAFTSNETEGTIFEVILNKVFPEEIS
jgi:signal transduction histidine kinase